MTQVTIFHSNGHIVGYEAIGHTGYAQEGSDVVCSAVSALTQTALMGLCEYLKLDVEYKIGDGFLTCRLKDQTLNEGAITILETMRLGLESIACTYGEYLKLIDREV